MNSKELFLALASSTTEAQVKQILDTNAYTQERANWTPLGKNQNNAAMVQNTAGSLGSCMTELATNAIDAVIARVKNTLEASGVVIPEHALASPQAFLEFALGEKYKDNKKREDFAHKNIKFLTTEAGEGKRMLTVIDQGCGQKAVNFSDTFCSVGSGQTNKANKNWLHGNYGQGSTSANAISGKYGYKMIVSRESEQDKWAFTVIRRCPLDPSMLEYLTCGESVLEFCADKIEMGIRVGGEVAKGEASLVYGSAIKLYDVKFDKGFTGIKRTMGIVFFRPALPIKSIEFSLANEKGNKPNGRDSRWLYGQGYEFDKMVKENKAEKEEFTIDVPELGLVRGAMYFLPKAEHVKEIMEWFPNNYLEKTKRVFHINNGQVQHTDQYSKVAQYFPKARDNVFIELDLSYFDKKMAKAYLWKADRTACQTSNEYFQIYDNLLNKFLENSDTLKTWALICNQEQMAKLKGSSSKIDDTMKTAFDLFNTRESKQYKANKQLIQSEGMSTYAKGSLALVSENSEENTDLTEVVGKEIPTMLASNHSTLESAKKASLKKISASLKTDTLKGAVNSRKSKIKINAASIISGGVEKEVNPNMLSMFVTEGSGSVNFEVSPNEAVKEELKVGDTLSVKISMTTEQDGQSHILESTVYFEIIENLREVKNKPRGNSLKDIFKKQYGTRDGRAYNNQKTGTLEEKEDGFSFNAGYHVYHNDGELIVSINLDNPKFQLKLGTYKDEDKANFMKYWEVSLLTKVMSKYHFWQEMGKTDLEALAESLNKTEDAAWLNEDCIQAASYHIKDTEIVISNATKKMAA